jgi:molybdenum cofactor cytidylyltransferase/nicotine blue oxidoreductase
MGIHGLLLAAGAGTRMGMPKALVDGWLTRSVDTLQAGGCHDVTVVLGAGADEASKLLAEAGVGVRQVVADDWAEGMGASLRAGLRDLARPGYARRADAALVTLVDLPDVGPDVVRRVLTGPVGTDTLRRASYDGTPGHPVLLGRDHWTGVADSATGDRGARDYLRAHEPELVECGDLATGADSDRPPGDTPTSDQPPRQ